MLLLIKPRRPKMALTIFVLSILMSKPIVIPAMNFTFLVAQKTPLFLVQIP